MRILNDFRCSDCGTEREEFLDNSITSVECAACGGTAKRIIRPVRSNLDPISGDFPGATMAWDRGRMGTMKRERKDSAYDSSYGTIVRD